MTQEQNAGQNHNTQLANKFFGNVLEVSHPETTPTNQNYISEELDG
jgi:hypothetical protein